MKSAQDVSISELVPRSAPRRRMAGACGALMLMGSLGACGNAIDEADGTDPVVLTEEEGELIQPASADQLRTVQQAATAYEDAAGLEMELSMVMGDTAVMDMTARTNLATDFSELVAESTLSMPILGDRSVHMLMVDGYIYMEMEGQAIGPNGETWTREPLQGLPDGAAPADPNQASAFLDTLGEAGEVSLVGSDEVDGTPVEVYEFSAPGDALADLQSTGKLSDDSEAILEATEVTGTVSIAEDGQPRAMTFNMDMGAAMRNEGLSDDELAEVGGGMSTVELKMSPIDEAVSVTAPPAEDVADVSEAMGAGLGG